MGVGGERDGMIKKGGRGKGKGNLAGNGMRDVWVIGEGFFRGVGGVFDVSFFLSFFLSPPRPFSSLLHLRTIN